jgi:hypothetical protein
MSGFPARTSDDTAPEAAATMDSILRRMTPAEKLDRVRQLTIAAAEMSLSGLRHRNPLAGRRDLLFELTRLRLGDALATAAFGRTATPDA